VTVRRKCHNASTRPCVRVYDPYMKRLASFLVLAFTIGLMAWMLANTDRVLDACVECGE
jgi:hypothetical protein